MPSHLETIGFWDIKNEKFEELSYSVKEKGKEIIVDDTHRYFQWKCGKGIELWVLLEDNYFICFSPYYSSKNHIDMRIVEEISDNPCEGCRGYLGEVLDSSAASDMPIIFDIPDSLITRRKTEYDTIHSVELVGFAEQIKHHKTLEEFQEEKPKYSPEYYIPCGLWSPRDDPDFKQSAHAFLAGCILKSKTIVNPLTGNKFYHLKINNSLIKLDIVVSSRAIDYRPQRGEIIDGTIWFTGRVT